MIKKILSFLLACFVLGLLSACGPKYQLTEAQRLEKDGCYVEAGIAYENLYKRYPGNVLAAEALYRAGSLYQHRLKLYSQAVKYYRKVIELYPNSQPWGNLARLGLLTSPDYYPLTQGSFWIEGDSETGGMNMRSEWTCRSVSSGTYTVQRRVFAGTQLVQEYARLYRKEDMQVREFTDPSKSYYSALISYPYYEGKVWQSKYGDHFLTHKIVGTGIALKVKAGEFVNCVKVSEENSVLPGSIKFNYYAPDAGWVLTTTAASGGTEHHITELLSYKIMPQDTPAGKK